MKLASFSVENYRAFARRQVIDIRPLTLFFGWNSGGKSALVRFLPLLAESVQVGGPPIWLAGDVGKKATWSELVCKATGLDAFRFSLQWVCDGDEQPWLSEWRIRENLDENWQWIDLLVMTHGKETISFNDAMENWAGLSPPREFNGNHDYIDSLDQMLKHLRQDVQWISGVRVHPPRIALYGGGTLPRLRSDGEDAVDHLIAAQLQSSEAPLLDVTRRFFSALGEQLVLDNPMDGAWRLLLHPANSPLNRINLCDTGEGYSQVLPILVALAKAQTGGPRTLCLEQPELHLHTSAQAILANLLVQTAKCDPSPSILVETHSEVLLMSIQLAIAKGEITPDMVRVYWVESNSDGTSDARPVDFDGDGRPTNTLLIGAFDEAVRIGQELMTKQMTGRLL